jgi:hypothetical protein
LPSVSLQKAAGVNRHGVDFKHRRGGDRADCNCIGFLIATLDRHRIVRAMPARQQALHRRRPPARHLQ